MSKIFCDTMQDLLQAVAIENDKSLSQTFGKTTDNVVDLERFVKDGRLTEPSDGKQFEWKKMIEEVKRQDH